MRDFPAFVDSMNRLVDLADARDVSHVARLPHRDDPHPKRDYFFGSRYQPDEPPLQMTPDQLRALRDAAVSIADQPGTHRFDDFVIYHGAGLRTQLPVIARGLVGQARDRLLRR